MVTRSIRQRVRLWLLFSHCVRLLPFFFFAGQGVTCQHVPCSPWSLIKDIWLPHTHTCRHMTKYSYYCNPLPTSWPLTRQPLPVKTHILPYYFLVPASNHKLNYQGINSNSSLLPICSFIWKLINETETVPTLITSLLSVVCIEPSAEKSSLLTFKRLAITICTVQEPH